ncbi:hypothetical protein MKX03_002487 [Papaver bracteatum]|nr:hypothetical protein MKX03_002487 [Papaver bracteatum]
MSMEQGVQGDTESFESKLCRLTEYQARTQLQLEVYQEQNQHQLGVYQQQNQRQLDVLTTSLTRLIESLDQNAKFVNNVAVNDSRVGLEVNSGQNLENEQESGQHDTDSENQNTSEEIEGLTELHPQQQQINDSTVVSPVDSPTVELNSSNHCSTFILDHAYLPLYEATQEGNWEIARELLMDNRKLLTSPITRASDTILLIAAENNHWFFVEELMELMPSEALVLKDTIYGNSILHIAAREGNKKVSEALVKKNPSLTQIRDNNENVPLHTAAFFVSQGQKETIEYLCTVTTDEYPSPFSGPDGASLVCNILNAHFYDIALDLFHQYPNLIMEKTKNRQMWPLEIIAERPHAFRSGSELKWWQRCIYNSIELDMTTPLRSNDGKGDVENPSGCLEAVSAMRMRGIITQILSYFITHMIRVSSIGRIYSLKQMHEQAAALVKGLIYQVRIMTTKTEALDFFANSSILETAIKFGTNEVVEECLEHFPDLNWTQMNNKRLIQIAIEERNEKVLELILKTSKDYKHQLVSRRDKCGNNILHYAANLGPLSQRNSASGAALQMQREMQWFKGVETLVHERDRLVRNKDGNTAQFIFTKKHNTLRKEGEAWMKDTSQSCMVVAALIATVVFAAAFTVPGGNLSEDENGNKAGTPIFLDENAFLVFAAADALALFSSIASILMFLAILTSRYAEEDFLTSLPTKLIIGLGTLFFSIATTMIAFGAALSIVLGSRFTWVLMPTVLCACVPVSLFAFLQFPLLFDMVRSTYQPIIFGNSLVKKI